MVLSCFAATGPGPLTYTERTMNSKLYQEIAKENVKVVVSHLKLNRSWMMQQDNGSIHTRKSTSWLS
ncbi:hypothetical protein LDENG_00007380 [Lucifuga dentata]|nr:hypothetical protein LDENG_00007380 [Lucifuga dentata]